jgi:hypothetical protein
MSYIGASPTTTAFVTDSFNGNASTTAFTMSVAPANPSSALVAISGVLQDPTTYSVSGTTLTFSSAPPLGTGNISVRYLGIPASGITTTAYRTLTEFTATAGQTTFSPPSYTVGYINVYRNGSRLGTADFTATNGTSVALNNAAGGNDLIAIESFYITSVTNALPQTGGVINAPLGAVPLQVLVNSSEYLRIDTSGNVGFSTNGSPSTQNGLVSLAVGMKGSQNLNFGFETNGLGYGGQLEFRRTSRATSPRYAQIGGLEDGSGNGFIQFYTSVAGSDVAERARINSYGLGLGGTIPSTGTGIAFPATQSASSDPNTLDDYEEGTWTPNVGGTATYSSQIGTYTKIGNTVYIRASMQINSIGTGSTYQVFGYPFTSSSDVGTPFTVGYYSNLSQGIVWMCFYLQSNNTNSLMAGNASSNTTIGLNGAAIFQNSTRVDWAGFYKV